MMLHKKMLLCFVPGCGNTILHACEVLETPKKESVFSVLYTICQKSDIKKCILVKIY